MSKVCPVQKQMKTAVLTVRLAARRDWSRRRNPQLFRGVCFLISLVIYFTDIFARAEPPKGTAGTSRFPDSPLFYNDKVHINFSTQSVTAHPGVWEWPPSCNRRPRPGGPSRPASPPPSCCIRNRSPPNAFLVDEDTSPVTGPFLAIEGSSFRQPTGCWLAVGC